jgi:hypothetical protein
LLVNGQITPGGSTTYSPVEGRVGPVIDATITSLMAKVTQGSAYRLWVVSMAYGADFHVTFIPPDYPLTSGTLEFIPPDQTALFEFGYRRAVDETAWFTQSAPETAEELVNLLIQSTEAMEHGAPAWMSRGATPE